MPVSGNWDFKSTTLKIKCFKMEPQSQLHFIISAFKNDFFAAKLK